MFPAAKQVVEISLTPVAARPFRFTGGCVQKKCQVAAAKEVGMGNPAEKNDRAPDMDILGDHLPPRQELF
jgi:hypothetical protein